MNKTVMQGKWHQTKGAVKKQWGSLTDDDVKMLLGEGEMLAGRLQERYGYTRERAEREVSEFMDSLDDVLPEAQEMVAEAQEKVAEAQEAMAEAFEHNPWIPRLLLMATGLVVTAFLLVRFVPIRRTDQ
jgi:uncharacterized protein YjbJ (UPF0337 family)